MILQNPLSHLPTHEVINMPPHLGDQEFWLSDTALREGIERECGSWAMPKLEEYGKIVGTLEVFEKAYMANRYSQKIRPIDRYGMRISQVEYPPTYNELMDLAIEIEMPNFAWNHPQPGGQVVHAALSYMFNQAGSDVRSNPLFSQGHRERYGPGMLVSIGQPPLFTKLADVAACS